MGSNAKRLKDMGPFSAYCHAYTTIKGRWHEAEATIAKDPLSACLYAMNILGKRWPRAEAVIAGDSESSYCYAMNVTKGRWPLGEKIIVECEYWGWRYCNDVIKGRWREYEIVMGKRLERFGYIETFEEEIIDGLANPNYKLTPIDRIVIKRLAKKIK